MADETLTIMIIDRAVYKVFGEVRTGDSKNLSGTAGSFLFQESARTGRAARCGKSFVSGAGELLAPAPGHRGLAHGQFGQITS